MKVLWVIAQCR